MKHEQDELPNRSCLCGNSIWPIVSVRSSATSEERACSPVPFDGAHRLWYGVTPLR
jgi:hypothetical protein